nr:hypothetical protein LKV13_04380 [Borrelia sp. BU AG58]
MNTGFFYFFSRVLDVDGKKVYVSHLYDSLVTIEPDLERKWLKIYFEESKRGRRYFFLFVRNESNGSFISCNFLKTKTNYGLDIKFSDGNLNIFCKDRKSLEFLKARVERFFKSGSGCPPAMKESSTKEGNKAKAGKVRVVLSRNKDTSKKT